MPAAITIVVQNARPEIRIGEYEVIGVEADLGDRLEERSVEKALIEDRATAAREPPQRSRMTSTRKKCESQSAVAPVNARHRDGKGLLIAPSWRLATFSELKRFFFWSFGW